MFLKTKFITAKRSGRCNAFHCQHKTITKGERVIWTVHTYRFKTISAVWHPECHKQSTAFAPCWGQLLKIQQNRAAMPHTHYNPKTGLPWKQGDNPPPPYRPTDP